MTTIAMRNRDEDFLISEANGELSRDAVKFSAPLTAPLAAGSVIDLWFNDDHERMADPATATGDTVTADAVLARTAPIGATHGTVIDGDAEVDGDLLIWPENITDVGKATGISLLAGNGIIVR